MIEITDEQMREALQRSCDDQMETLRKAKEMPKEFHPEHLKRMGVTMVKGGENETTE